MNPKIWRETHKLSLAAMGDRIGCTAPSVHRYERGERFPDPETVAAFTRETAGAVTYEDFIAIRAARRQALDAAVTADVFREKQSAAGGRR